MKSKISIAILAALILTLLLGAMSVVAAGEPTTFFITLKHYIKGDEIDLTRNAPLNISVIKDGVAIKFFRMEYMQRVDANLPEGKYDFVFYDAMSGDILFKCSHYKFENGDNIHMQIHEQGAGRLPKCYVH